MAADVCGYIEAGGVRYWKPNLAALDGDLARRIMNDIRSASKPDEGRLEAECKAVEDRIRKAKEDGTY